MRLKPIGVIILWMLITQTGFSENTSYYSDAGSWNTLSIDYALNKKWAIVFTEELRIKENYGRLNLLYTNLGMEYSYGKHIKTSLVYRFIDKYMDENNFSFRHRLSWDASYKTKLKKLILSYRHRLQVEVKTLNSSETGKIPEWYSRSKFEIGYQVSPKLSPYFSTELRYQLKDPRNVESEHTWHRTRYQFGVDYRLNKFSKAGIYYLIQREYNVSIPENLYITGLEYSISLASTKWFKKK